LPSRRRRRPAQHDSSHAHVTVDVPAFVRGIYLRVHPDEGAVMAGSKKRPQPGEAEAVFPSN
jgi:hypothetical protein